MNNAQIIMEDVNQTKDNSVIYREKVERLTDVVEALQNIASSSYWAVLQKYVFNVDLAKAKRRLVKADDTIEIFRLQGQIDWAEKLNLEKLLQTKRDELTAIRKKL